MHPVVSRIDGLCYGGDYNPEQWPEHVWAEDVALMREAGVTLATVGVFSWAWLEPEEGRYEFGWLDRVLDLLAENGIAVDLATATASPPPWFSHAYPQTLPVDADGRTLTYGSRQAYCPSSPIYREAATRLVKQLATRYATHPSLALWHVNNEYGCHIARCYCDTSAAAFRTWLQQRYGDLDALNAAWGTAFWSQRHTAWEQVQPPRATPTFPNPTQVLDFHRFSSDELLDCYRAERDLLHRLSPGVPVTTNLMAWGCWELDYWAWGPELDVVSNDHYLRAEDPENQINLAFSADLSRSIAGGDPWLLMEHSTSAVNWQPRNVAKTPGQLRRNSLAHVARGSEGAMFFQWRQSAAGAEKFHSAMLPHAGTRTKVWREVVQLGADLGRLAEIKGSTVDADVVLLLDWSSLWAQRHACQPSVDMAAVEEIEAWHGALWRAGITADLRPPDADLSGYRLVLAPSLYLISDDAAKNLAGYAASGGTLVVGPYSGIVDPNDHVRLGGYPGALTDLLGVRIEEFFPLPADGTVTLDDGSTGRVWSEQGEAVTAEVVARYADTSAPAITRNPHGDGAAWYLTTRLDTPSRQRFLERVAAEAGVRPAGTAPGVEAVRRRHPDTGVAYHFLINHTETDADVPAHGTDLLSGNTVSGVLRLPAGGVAVIREDGEA